MNGAAGQEKMGVEAYQQVWIESAAEVLRGVVGGVLNVERLTAEQTRTEIQSIAASGAWRRFAVGKPLAGEHAVLTSVTDGLKLGQLRRGEPTAEEGAFDPPRQEAFTQLIGLMAGAAAAALGAKLGAAVEITLAGSDRPSWSPAAPFGFRLKSQRFGEISLYFVLSGELAAALEVAGAPAEVAPSGNVKEPEVASAQRAEARTTNIDLLKDVELAVTLRFGERQVLLRDVLELVPGAVVELDQQVDDPVELLVGKKVIARGEVVVVDGNYGLRVTEIASPAERIASLRK
jgi:flagellar motor switch protein FliN/FliY